MSSSGPEDASLDEEELLSDCRSCTRSSREISLPQSRGFFPIEASVRSVWDWDGWSGVMGLQTILGWLSVKWIWVQSTFNLVYSISIMGKSVGKYLAGLHTNSYLTVTEVTIAWLIYKQQAKKRVFFRRMTFRWPATLSFIGLAW
jgi:hypothetical protein